MSSSKRNARRVFANRAKAGLTLTTAISGLMPLLFHTNTAGATTFTWDPGLTAPSSSPSGGAGTWDLNTTANWASAGVDSMWTDATGTSSTALFATPGGSVTLNNNLGALEAVFSASLYSFNQGGTNTLALNGSTVKNSIVLDATSAGVGSSVIFNVPVSISSNASTLETSGTVTFNSPVSVATGTPLFAGNNLGAFTGTTVTAADYTDQPATFVFAAGITGNFAIGGGNLVPQVGDPVLAVWSDPTVTDPFGGTGTTTKVVTIAYNGSLKANNNLVINGEVSLSGGTPSGMGDLSIHSTTLSGTGNISIGASSGVTAATATIPLNTSFINANDNNFVINNLSGGATFTIGSATTAMAIGNTAQNGRVLTIGGSGNTVINSPIEDSSQAAASNNYTNSTLAKAGTGTLTINNTSGTPSNYKGATQIQNGTLVIGTTNALPTGIATGTGGTPGAVILGALGGVSGTLDLAGNNQTVTSISLAQNTAGVGVPSAWTFSLNSPFVSLAGVSIPNSGLAVGETVQFTAGLFDNGTNTATITSIEDNGKSSATTKLSLSSDLAPTSVTSGTIVLSSPGAAGGVIGNSSVTSDSTLTVSTVANVNAAWNTFGGTIEDSIGSGTHKMNLIVVGTSSLNLTGNNTYTGTTAVSSGATLALTSPGALSTTNVSVDAVSTLDLAGGTLGFDLLSTGLTSSIQDLGALNISGTNTINLFSTDVSLTPGVYTMISDLNGFTDTPTSFLFSNSTTTESLVVGGTPYTVTITDPSTAVTLTVSPVPEPASAALLGIAGLGLLRRRKRSV